MSGFLLDSDVIIWHLRGRRETTEMLRELAKADVPGCSALSVLEVQVGVRRGEEENTDRFLGSLKIFDVTVSVANKAARLIRQQRGKGVRLGLPDAVIAGTCLIHDMILVTYNVKHYPIPGLTCHPVSLPKP